MFATICLLYLPAIDSVTLDSEVSNIAGHRPADVINFTTTKFKRNAKYKLIENINYVDSNKLCSNLLSFVSFYIIIRGIMYITIRWYRLTRNMNS